MSTWQGENVALTITQGALGNSRGKTDICVMFLALRGTAGGEGMREYLHGGVRENPMLSNPMLSRSFMVSSTWHCKLISKS